MMVKDSIGAQAGMCAQTPIGSKRQYLAENRRVRKLKILAAIEGVIRVAKPVNPENFSTQT